MKVERKRRISVAEFIRAHVIPNRPVIITDGMDTWRAKRLWTPEYFEQQFGSEKVLVYGDLFTLVNVCTLSEYLAKYFGRNEDLKAERRGVPYVRWYTRFTDSDRVPWADGIFDRLKGDWSNPYFCPGNSLLLPPCAPDKSINPNAVPFPARGLFISPRGARTRLHADPWHSDAILCQLLGRKKFIMYSPQQAQYLRSGTRVVDIEAPDLKAFPRFPEAQITFEDELNPGEIVFIPTGWHHHFRTVSDSISLTWNYVHMSRVKQFCEYLTNDPPQAELETIRYFGAETNPLAYEGWEWSEPWIDNETTQRTEGI